eukprot:9383784-Alexandrium_andersonii.AAC.1
MLYSRRWLEIRGSADDGRAATSAARWSPCRRSPRSGGDRWARCPEPGAEGPGRAPPGGRC